MIINKKSYDPKKVSIFSGWLKIYAFQISEEKEKARPIYKAAEWLLKWILKHSKVEIILSDERGLKP
jgi:hypothetical protein